MKTYSECSQTSKELSYLIIGYYKETYVLQKNIIIHIGQDKALYL